jgi:SAM-dependent methyltransferase
VRELKALAPARIKWALELLDVQPNDSVLEIGCGSGIAAQRILEKLTGKGWYYGVDKSDAAVKATFKRVHDPERPDRAIIRKGAFDADNHEPLIFNRVIAVNCNVFWTDDGEAIRGAHRLTGRSGSFVQVYETPTPAQRTKIARILQERMSPLFVRTQMIAKTVADAPLLAVVAEGSAPQAVT